MDAAKIKALFAKVPSRDGGEGSEEDPRLSAAEDIIAAVKSGDAEALDVALADHYRLCSGPMDEESGE